METGRVLCVLEELLVGKYLRVLRLMELTTLSPFLIVVIVLAEFWVKLCFCTSGLHVSWVSYFSG